MKPYYFLGVELNLLFELFHDGLISEPVIQKKDSKELLETFCDLALSSIYFQAYDYITSGLSRRHFNENIMKFLEHVL